MNSIPPKNNSSLTTIIILTYNGLSFTKNCLQSIYQHTDKKFELILIDNGSTDGTLEFLRSLPNVKVIANSQNKGYPGGCNQGLSLASGENIVLLNNDTIVTNGWLSRLIRWLNQDSSIGIVGPRSNFISAEQIIMPVPYESMDQMHNFADEWTIEHDKHGFEAEQLSGLCMVFKRSLIDIIGGMDERFFPGYFEDTDFSIRTRISEKKLWVANDVFIHHYGSASFKENRWQHYKTIQESKSKFFKKWKMDNLDQITMIVQREKPFNLRRHYIPLL